MRLVRWLAAGASMLVALTALAADAGAGKEVYSRCLACHALAYDRTGPRHCGLFGRRAGSVKGFAYSEAMKRSKIVWGPKTLDRFLENPLRAMPGTAMGYAGVTDKKERANLIAYLGQANASAECAGGAERTPKPKSAS